MNDKDIQLAQRLSNLIKSDHRPASLTASISAPTVNIARINISLLKAMLDLLHKQGIFVTIDRPHQYAEHLLRIHNIDFSKLTFIDMISAYAGDRKVGFKEWTNSHGPFSLGDILDLIKLSNAAKESLYVDLLQIDFILFDNIGSLLVYNRADSVKRFLGQLMEQVKKTSGIFVAFVIDPRNYADLFDDVNSRSDICIEIGQDMSILDVHDTGCIGEAAHSSSQVASKVALMNRGEFNETNTVQDKIWNPRI